MSEQQVLNPGQRVRELRKARGWSGHKLAAISGVTVTTIYAFENGSTKPYTDTIKRIADALDVEPGALI